MKRKNLFTSILFLCSFIFAFSIIETLHISNTFSYAEIQNITEETNYDSLYINDLSGVSGDSYTLDSNNNVSSLSSFGRVGFDDNYTNIEVKATIKFTTTGNTVFRLRATGSISDNTFTNQGYFFRWYPNGMFDFVKDSTVINSATWGPLPAVVVDTDYDFVFKTVNLTSGDVHIVIKINNTTFVDYTDSSEPIQTKGMFAISSEGSALSATGLGFNSKNAFDLNHISTPFTSSNFPGATITDSAITTASNGSYSGVVYAYQSTGEYTIKAKITPIETSQMIFMIGASKTNSHEPNRPDVISSGEDGWGWDNAGYAYYWNANGQRYFSRGAGYDSSGLLNYSWIAGYTSNTTYNIEFGLKALVDGQIRIHFKVNDSLVLNYLDTSNTFNFNTLGNAPATLYSYSEILSIGSMRIEPYEQPTVSQNTIISSDLGTPIVTNNAVTLDRNGIPSNFTEGGVAYYNTNKINYSVSFRANFSTIGTNLVASIAKQGTLFDNNITWTNGGYSVYFYPNSQIILYKNSQKICEGWALGWKTFDTANTYTFTISVINVSDSATLLKVTIDDQLMLNYLDANEPINNAGWFTLDSNGFTGTLNPVGINIPTITTSLISNTFDCKNQVTLSYSVDEKSDNDVITYYIDESKTTATASIEGNILTATSAGTIAIYVQVNGIYSNDIIITSTKASPIIETITTPIIVGGEKVTLIAKMDDNSSYSTKKFKVQNGTGSATIDSNTGEITAIKAGTIKVWVTIDEVDSIQYTLQISPKIVINIPYLAVDGTVQASYVANCELPDESITTEYSIISMTPQVTGKTVAEVDSETGLIYGKAIGKYVIKVVVRGQTFMGTSTLEHSVSVPVVTIGIIEDMYVGQTITIAPNIEGGIIVSSKEIIIIEGASLVQVNGLQVKAKKQGHVVLKAKINGLYESQIPQAFDISILTPTIIASDIRTGKTQQLSVMFNYQSYTPEHITYSIINGSDLARIDGDTLTAFNKTGKITIKAIIDDIYETTLDINIINKTQLKIANNQYIAKRHPIKIDFFYDLDDDEEITSVKYVLVSGFATLTTINAEDPTNCYANLTIYGRGPVQIKVIVNDNESVTQTIYPINKLSDIALALIIIGSIILTATIVWLIIYLVKRRKAKKSSNPQSKQKQRKNNTTKTKKNK